MHLNEKLIMTLTKVLGLTHKTISDTTGIAIGTWYRIVKEPSSMTVQQLLALANGLQIPVRRFFTLGRQDKVGTREDYVERDYHPCSYEGAAIVSMIGRGTAITQKEAAEAMGLPPIKIRETLCGYQRLTVNKLLAFCKAFSVDVFKVLVDPNETIEAKRLNKAEVNKLKAEIEELKKELKSLRHDYELLKEAHNLLARKSKQPSTEPPTHKSSDALPGGEGNSVTRRTKATKP